MPTEAIKLYGQMNNTCGLASFLMILQPESHGMAEVLTQWWGGVKNVIKAVEAQQVELNWERVLNYILLKALRHPRLRSYVEEKLGDAAMEYFIIFEGRVQEGLRQICARYGPSGMFLKNNFESAAVVCDPLLQIHLDLMKQDSELKILYRFFGYKFHHHYEAEEPTGAINFTKEEVKDSNNPGFQKKIKILEQAIQAKHTILLGLGHHWMALKTLKAFEEEVAQGVDTKIQRRNYFAYLLDSEVKQEKTLPLQRINQNYMFYIFERDEAELKTGIQLIDDVLIEDLPKDAEVYRRFKANEIGAEEPLKTQLVELFGVWPLPEEMREELVEEGEEEEEEVSRELEAESMDRIKPLPTEDEMAQKLRAAIKKAFTDYSKI